MEQCPEQMESIISSLENCIKEKGPGGVLEKWPRNYYKVAKLGPVYHEAFLKAVVNQEIDALTWSSMRIKKRKAADKELSDTELAFFFAINTVPEHELPTHYKKVFFRLAKLRYRKNGSLPRSEHMHICCDNR